MLKNRTRTKPEDAMHGHRHLSISEFRHELGLPLTLAHKMMTWGVVEAEKAADGTIQVTEAEVDKAREIIGNPWKKFQLYLRNLGPGLITGASDSDPTTIGTFSYVGAFFGYQIIWMVFWLLPFMTAIQETCARIGIVTNRGLAGVMRKHYNHKFVFLIIVLLIATNVINVGADISAMSEAARLLIPVNFNVIALSFTVLILIIEILLSYKDYAKFLKILTITLLAYIITGFIIHPEWLSVFKQALIPSISLNKEFLFAMIAIFGTTISPYIFFWQTSEEVEENKEEKREGFHYKLPNRIRRMRTDVNSGMIFANLTFFFIVITTAEVLAKNGITTIESAQQAAQALRPFAGDQAFLFFALGIIGTGLLAVPILAGSGAYALSEIMGWREGLSQKFGHAKAFYAVIIVSLLIGFGLNLIGINPIKALYYSSFINGLAAVPLVYAIMVVGNDKKIMGRETNPGWVKFFGWAAFAFAAISVIAVVYLNVIK